MAQACIAFQGLPVRICWLVLAFNEMVRNSELKASKDSSDAVSDWPLLNALLNTTGGATWVSLHHGGVGMGFSQHAGG